MKFPRRAARLLLLIGVFSVAAPVGALAQVEITRKPAGVATK